jgi:hypothetical protein
MWFHGMFTYFPILGFDLRKSTINIDRADSTIFGSKLLVRLVGTFMHYSVLFPMAALLPRCSSYITLREPFSTSISMYTGSIPPLPTIVRLEYQNPYDFASVEDICPLAFKLDTSEH